VSHVAVGRWMRASIVAGASLASAIAPLLSAGSATAQGLSLPLPAVHVSLPAVGVSLPGVSSGTHTTGASLPSVGVSLPSVGVSLPSVGVTLPSVGVTVPSVGVTLPGVGVSTPEVSVATPEVTVSTPQVTVSTPSSPGSGSSETPSGSAPTGGGSSGGGSAGGGSGSGSSGGEAPGGSSGGAGSGSSGAPSPTSNGSLNATAASAADSAGARTSSPTPAALAPRRRAAGSASGGKRSLARSRHAPSASNGRGAGAVTGATDAAGITALDLASSRARPASPAAARRASKPASNPLDAIGRHIPLPLPVPDWSKPIILLLALLAIGLGLRSRTVVRRARRLERQRVTLLRDVGAMQAALVPEVPARVGGLGVSVAYRPAEGPAAGGDFYDVFVPERGKVAIILGDVAGHGHQALTQAALTRYTLRAYLQAGLQPRAALALAGRVLADPEAERFATVALAVYDTREGQLTYASAGHPAPLVHGPQTRAPIEVCASPPIGWTVPTGRRQTIMSLTPGAVVCFFSDGLIEARCKDDLLGRERLGELLAGLGPRPDAAKLLARVRKTALATPDDMAACILAPELAVVGVRTHVEELEVEARALAGGKVQLFLETCELPIAEIEPTIECASEVVAVWGSALLSVELEGDRATAAVSMPSAEPRVAMPDGRPQPAGGPSGQL
jgi:hypothetical protein